MNNEYVKYKKMHLLKIDLVMRLRLFLSNTIFINYKNFVSK